MAQKKSRKVILTSPAGIDREYLLPADAIRTRRNQEGLYAALCVARFLQHFSVMPSKSRFDAKTQAEIDARVDAEIERRHNAMMDAHRAGNLPKLSFRVLPTKKGQPPRFEDVYTKAQRKYHTLHVKPLAFRSEDVRAEIEAEYV